MSDIKIEIPGGRLSKSGEATVARPLWSRLSVTAIAFVLAWLPNWIPLWGLSRETFLNPEAYDLWVSQGMIMIGAFGIRTVLSAYFVVECATLIVFRWRSLRLGGPKGRNSLRNATVVVAIVLSLTQATIYSHNLVSPNTLVLDPSSMFWLRISTTLTLSFVTFALWGLTKFVDRYGLGSGFSVILCVALIPFTRSFLEMVPTMSDLVMLITIAFMIFIGFATLRTQRHSIDSGWLKPTTEMRPTQPQIPVPASGLAPIYIASSVLIFVSSLSNLELIPPGVIYLLAPGNPITFVVELGLAVVLCVVLSWLFNDPSRIQVLLKTFPSDIQSRYSPEATTTTVRQALRISVAYIVFLVFVSNLGIVYAPWVGFDVLLVATVVAVFLDCIREWRAWTYDPTLVSVWPLHRLYAVAPVVEVLRTAGIFAFPRAFGHRTLLQFFGPYVPVEILVPAKDADRARTILTNYLLPKPTEPDLKREADTAEVALRS